MAKLTDERELEQEIADVRAQLEALNAERVRIEATLRDLGRQRTGLAQTARHTGSIQNAQAMTTVSPTADKVALFRRLFAGRPDVFPLRWENPKTGKSGYSPACAHEWVRGVCGKPQVKCGKCPNQAFVPVSDSIIDKHLRGGDGSRSAGAFVAAGGLGAASHAGGLCGARQRRTTQRPDLRRRVENAWSG